MCVYTGMCVCEVDGAHMPVCMYVHKVVYVCVCKHAWGSVRVCVRG